MATNTYVALDKVTLGSTAASATFSSIPSTYTDLVIVASIKYTVSGDYAKLTFNGDTATNYSSTYLIGNGSAASSGRTSSQASINVAYDANNETFTDIFNVQNYSNSTTYKTVLNRHSVAGTRAEALVGLWRSTSAITSVTLTASTNFAAGSTFSLYGIRGEGTLTTTAKATGGTITYDDFYFYHKFTSSGTFTPTQSLTCDILTVAGGGAGGVGGGGAGGILAINSQSLSTTGYSITVGAGGTAGGYGTPSLSTAGGNSSFGSFIASVGGGKGAPNDNTTSSEYSGGSGGGGGGSDSRTTTAGLGTSGQGFNGGTNGGSTGGPYPAGGGGGSGAAGSNASSGNGGAGGIGTNSVINWGPLSQALTTTSSGVSGRIAAGGGGGTNGGNSGGAGGTGGGGAGSPDSNPAGAGTTNTGSGGGGSPLYQGAGGSGLVIVRYLR